MLQELLSTDQPTSTEALIDTIADEAGWETGAQSRVEERVERYVNRYMNLVGCGMIRFAYVTVKHFLELRDILGKRAVI